MLYAMQLFFDVYQENQVNIVSCYGLLLDDTEP